MTINNIFSKLYPTPQIILWNSKVKLELEKEKEKHLAATDLTWGCQTPCKKLIIMELWKDKQS